jgi:predicted enzyme related to lactoylglutathione lyase
VISGVGKVIIPAEDQERAKEFWTTRLGFEVTTDAPYGEQGRWLEVTPPDRSIALVLTPRAPDEPRPEFSDKLPHSPVFFSCEDIQQTHRELTERGVRFPGPPTEMPFGWWSMFEDDDGTRYALEQR